MCRVGIGDLAQVGRQPADQLVDHLGVEVQKILGVDRARLGAADAGGDQLDRALEQLRGAFDADVVAVLEAAKVVLAGVPHPGADRAAAIRQVDLQVEVAVAIGPQLFFGGQKDLIDRLLMSQLTDKPPCHGNACL